MPRRKRTITIEIDAAAPGQISVTMEGYEGNQCVADHKQVLDAIKALGGDANSRRTPTRRTKVVRTVNSGG